MSYSKRKQAQKLSRKQLEIIRWEAEKHAWWGEVMAEMTDELFPGYPILFGIDWARGAAQSEAMSRPPKSKSVPVRFI